MKFYSPFFIFILLVLVSCRQQSAWNSSKNVSQTDSVDYYLKVSKSSNLSLAARNDFINKAYVLALSNANDSIVNKVLAERIDFTSNHFPDSLLTALKSYEEFALKSKNDSYIGYSYYQFANYYEFIRKSDSAYVDYNKSNEYYQKTDDRIRMSYNLLMMARLSYSHSDFSGSEESANDALILLNSENENKYIADFKNVLNNHLGLTYTGSSDYDNAIKYYEIAASINKDSISELILLNNKAYVRQAEGKYGQVIFLLENAYKSKVLDSVPEIKAKILNNLGYAYYKTNQSSGINYMLEALKIRLSINDTFGLVASYLRLSEYYLQVDSSLSKSYAKKAYDLATQDNIVDDRLLALTLLGKWSSSKQESDEIFEKYTKINDSIQKSRQSATNKFAKMRYDYSEKEKQVLKAEKTSQSLIFAIIGIIAAFLFLYLIIRIYHKKEKLKESYKTETRIAKKVHDELANDMYNVMTFADSQDLSLPDQKEKLVATLDNVYSRTRDISRQNSSIETGHKYAENLKEMLSEYKNNITNVLINGLDDIDWTEIDENKKVIIYRVLQELMVNMKKHSQATLCMLLFKKSSKKIEINYSDNGIGIDLEKLIYKNGLANTETRIKSIKGNITFVSTPDKGFKISFNFPI